MNELEKLTNKKNIEQQEDKINSIYIKNNINDLHNLLNEKENKEKELVNEIEAIKVLSDQKVKELTDIINEKQKEIEELSKSKSEHITT